MNTYDFNHDLFEAVKAPRIHHQLIPNLVGFETGYDEAILRALEEKGHQVQKRKHRKRKGMAYTLHSYRTWLRQVPCQDLKRSEGLRTARYMLPVIQEREDWPLLIRTSGRVL